MSCSPKFILLKPVVVSILEGLIDNSDDMFSFILTNKQMYNKYREVVIRLLCNRNSISLNNVRDLKYYKYLVNIKLKMSILGEDNIHQSVLGKLLPRVKNVFYSMGSGATRQITLETMTRPMLMGWKGIDSVSIEQYSSTSRCNMIIHEDVKDLYLEKTFFHARYLELPRCLNVLSIMLPCYYLKTSSSVDTLILKYFNDKKDLIDIAREIHLGKVNKVMIYTNIEIGFNDKVAIGDHFKCDNVEVVRKG